MLCLLRIGKDINRIIDYKMKRLVLKAIHIIHRHIPLPSLRGRGKGVGLLNDYDYEFRITAIKLTE